MAESEYSVYGTDTGGTSMSETKAGFFTIGKLYESKKRSGVFKCYGLTKLGHAVLCTDSGDSYCSSGSNILGDWKEYVPPAPPAGLSLVERLRACRTELAHEAADALERLTKERDKAQSEAAELRAETNGKALAWEATCAAITEAVPDWFRLKPTGVECIGEAIKQLKRERDALRETLIAAKERLQLHHKFAVDLSKSTWIIDQIDAALAKGGAK